MNIFQLRDLFDGSDSEEEIIPVPKRRRTSQLFIEEEDEEEEDRGEDDPESGLSILRPRPCWMCGQKLWPWP